MSQYRTAFEYEEIVRNMPVQEVQGLFETYKNSSSLGTKDTTIMNILENEIERRIANWEICEV